MPMGLSHHTDFSAECIVTFNLDATALSLKMVWSYSQLSRFSESVAELAIMRHICINFDACAMHCQVAFCITRTSNSPVD